MNDRVSTCRGAFSWLVRMGGTGRSYMYSATTNGVKVEVFPAFDAERSRPKDQDYDWNFEIAIHNLGDLKIWLVSRHWIVHDEKNKLYEIQS